jgi:hypothetical protein
MAANEDYKLKIGVDSREFTDEMKELQAQLKAFRKKYYEKGGGKKDGDDLFTKLKDGAGKLGAAILAVKGAQEAFNQTLGSTQVVGDIVANSTEAMRVGINTLGTALMGVNVNFREVIEKAYKLTAALDDFETAKIWGETFDAETNTQLLEQDVALKRISNDYKKAKNANDKVAMETHKKEMNRIFDERQEILKNQEADRKGVLEQAKAAQIEAKDLALASVGTTEEAFKKFGYTMEQVYRKLYVSREEGNFLDSTFQKYIDLGQKVSNERDISLNPNSVYFGKFEIDLTDSEKELRRFYESVYDVFTHMNDDVHKKVNETTLNVENKRQEILRGQMDEESREGFIIKLTKSTDENTKSVEKNTEKTKKYFDMRETLGKRLLKLNETFIEQEKKMGAGASFDASKFIEKNITSKTSTPVSSTSSTNLFQGSMYFNNDEQLMHSKSLEQQQRMINNVNQLASVYGIYSKEVEEAKKQTNAFSKAAGIATVYEISNSQKVDMMGQSISSLGSTIGGQTGQIMSLVGALVSEAAALTMVENSETGPYGWIAGIVGIAGIIAAMATANSKTSAYESGGIVGGNSMSGDRVNARLNSGEMVINRGQQQRLWDIIAGGNINSQIDNIKFVIEGQKLVGVTNNYYSKNNMKNTNY